MGQILWVTTSPPTHTHGILFRQITWETLQTPSTILDIHSKFRNKQDLFNSVLNKHFQSEYEHYVLSMWNLKSYVELLVGKPDLT